MRTIGGVGDVAGIGERRPRLCPVNALLPSPSIIACTPHLALLYVFGFLSCHYFVAVVSGIIVSVTFLAWILVYYLW